METKQIRQLTADDIDLRVGQVFKADGKDNAVSLLLYKNARVDMAIMDETFGSMNWQRRHEFKDGRLYCTVSVYDPEKQQWIDKEDVGTESNTEAEKGQASDSFKRACVNWGIGRELYTAPFVYIQLKEGETAKTAKFFVKEIGYDGNEISSLLIVDKNNNQRYSFRKPQQQQKSQQMKPNPQPQPVPAQRRQRVLEYLQKLDDITLSSFKQSFMFNSLSDISDDTINAIANYLNAQKK